MKKLFLFTLHILEIGKHLNKNTKEPCFIKINVVMQNEVELLRVRLNFEIVKIGEKLSNL